MKLYETIFKAMGTRCEIRLYSSTAEQALAAANSVIADVERLEALYSRYRASSFLSEINRIAEQGGSITVDVETSHLLNYAATCHAESNGLFDVSSGILRRAWDFKSGKLPDPVHIKQLLVHTGWQKLRWHEPVLEFPEPGMELDFGGIVKEYAADRSATLCQAQGIRHGMVNLGGDIRIIGPHPDGKPWQIGISDPQHPELPLQTLNLVSGALASSGDYERCITLDGIRYSHVLNPFTGWPVRYLAAVSVVADFCVVAGSASTIGMLMDAAGKDWLQQLGLPHLWVDTDGECGGSLANR
ncbi:MAG: FAD:protein FMN transferase [Pseudomonadota bacterium]